MGTVVSQPPCLGKGTREGGDRKEETRGDLEWVDGVEVGELMLSSRWRERDSG